MVTDDDIKRFMLLYRGNPRSFGNWDPQTKNAHTEKREAAYDDFAGHFDGTMGIGMVPLRDDDTCWWGAIDIDNHGKSEDTDIAGVEAAVVEAGYPLVCTRSKSGGVHLYLFLSEPAKAELVRRVLKMWADKLQIPGTDCLFPKHDRMNRDNDTGEKGLSNWINFPYFGARKSRTDRYAFINGKPAPFGMFLEYAEGKRQDAADIQRWANYDHSEAPPCLQTKFRDGFNPGERNTGVYQITVYARKKERDLDTAGEVAHELAEQYMPDLKYGERQKSVKSALSKTYNYKCSDFEEVCNRELCRKRKYGVSETQYNDMQAKALIPRFYDAIMWTGLDEPKWSVKAEVTDGVEYEIKYLATDELRKIDLFKKRMIEMTPVFLPTMKQGDWDAIIGPILSSKITMPMPEDTTELGMLKSRLREFLGKAKYDVDAGDPKGRLVLNRGLPCLQVHKGVEVVMFRAQDFDKYLKDTKTDTVRKNMWFKMLDNLGCGNDRVRVGAVSLVSVWFVSSEEYKPQQSDKHDFSPEY
jgi:hypothetical protein